MNFLYFVIIRVNVFKKRFDFYFTGADSEVGVSDVGVEGACLTAGLPV